MPSSFRGPKSIRFTKTNIEALIPIMATRRSTKSNAPADIGGALAENKVGATADTAREAALQQQAEASRAVRERTLMPNWKASRERIHKLADRMKKSFVDRDDAVQGILAALISRTGCVLLGPPGTAKSLLVSSIARECNLRLGQEDANYFEYLLTAHTMPEEIFGPTDIGMLLQDPPIVRRRTESRLPHAELAFLDEVFRGGSHILNTLLTILNERKYHNGRSIEEVPLVGFIGAANHPPQTEDLQAFYDRFPVRIWVDSVLRAGDSTMVDRARALVESDAANSQGAGSRDAALTMNDFRVLWALVRVQLGADPDAAAHGEQHARLREFTQNFATFQEDAGLSDRSFLQLWYFAGALDLVAGRAANNSYATGGRGHFDCFRYVAPTHRQQAGIRQKVKTRLSMAAPGGA